MWLNPFPGIWREDPARIPIPGDADGALARLRARTPRNGFRAAFKETCVGLVGTERVKIWHHRPLSRRSVLLVLDATVSHNGRAATLVGTYRRPKQLRISMSIWMVMVLLFIPTFFAVALVMWNTDRTGALMFMTVPSAMFVFACALFAYHSRRWDESKQYIERLLAERFEEAGK
jgi:hypothetical protein